MRLLEEAMYSAQVFEDPAPETGLYSWDLHNDLLFADSALARYFGLDPADTASGLPIETYLERVHPEDRPRLAKTIRDSIITNRSQQETYRVLGCDGSYHFVTGFGRGFRDANGDTIQYVGIVVPFHQYGGTRPTAH